MSRRRKRKEAKHRLKQQAPKPAPSKEAVELEQLTKKLTARDLIPHDLSLIKNKWTRRLAGGAVTALVVIFGALAFQSQMQGNITGISAEYRAVTNEAETPYGTVLQQFRIKDHRVALFTYLDDDGMAFVVFDMDSRSVLYEDKLKENSIEPNSVMALAQVLPGLLDETKQIDSLELTPTGFKIDGEEYTVELDGIHVKAVNGAAIERENVYLVSKSHEELIERNKIDVADLSIGYVGEEYNTGHFIIAAIDSKSNVYTFNQDHKGKISLTVHQTR